MWGSSSQDEVTCTELVLFPTASKMKLDKHEATVCRHWPVSKKRSQSRPGIASFCVGTVSSLWCEQSPGVPLSGGDKVWDNWSSWNLWNSQRRGLWLLRLLQASHKLAFFSSHVLDISPHPTLGPIFYELIFKFQDSVQALSTLKAFLDPLLSSATLT